MNRDKKSKKISIGFKRIYHMFVLSFSLMILLFFSMGVISLTKAQVKRAETCEELTWQVYDVFKSNIMIVNRINASLANTPELQPYRMAENIEYAYRICRVLKNTILPYDTIQSIGVIYTDSIYPELTDVVFTDVGVYALDAYYAHYQQKSLNIPHFSSENSAQSNGMMLSNALEDTEQSTMLLFFQLPSSYVSSQAMLVYELEYTNMVKQLDQAMTEHSVFELYDRQNRLLLYTREKEPGDYRPFIFTDPLNGYYATLSMHAGEYFVPLFKGIGILCSFVILFFILALNTSRFLAKRAYLPISRLLSLLGTEVDTHGENELYLLEQVLLNLKKENTEIMGQLLNHRQILMNQIVAALLEGTEMTEIEARYGLKSRELLARLTEKGSFCCCLIGKIDDYLTCFADRKTAQEQWVTRQTLCLRVQEFAEEYGQAFCTDCLGNFEIMGIFVCDSNADIQKRAWEICDKTQRYISLHYPFTVTFSIGWHCGDMSLIHYSYEDAQFFTQYAVFFGKNTIIHTQCVDSLINQSTGKKEDFSVETANVIKAIKSANEYSIEERLHFLFVAFKNLNDLISYRYGYFDLLSRLGKLVRQSSVDSSEILSYQLDGLYTNTGLSIDQTEKKLLNFCKRLSLKFQTPELSASDDGKYGEMVTFISTHLSDPALCLDLVAQEFSLNPSYLTRFFKSKNGKTLMKYVDEIRFENAKALLIGTNLSIKTIVKQVGYTDENNFCRKFRSREGVSPQFYRNLNKNC